MVWLVVQMVRLYLHDPKSLAFEGLFFQPTCVLVKGRVLSRLRYRRELYLGPANANGLAASNHHNGISDPFITEGPRDRFSPSTRSWWRLAFRPRMLSEPCLLGQGRGVPIPAHTYPPSPQCPTQLGGPPFSPFRLTWCQFSWRALFCRRPEFFNPYF